VTPDLTGRFLDVIRRTIQSIGTKLLITNVRHQYRMLQGAARHFPESQLTIQQFHEKKPDDALMFLVQERTNEPKMK